MVRPAMPFSSTIRGRPCKSGVRRVEMMSTRQVGGLSMEDKSGSLFFYGCQKSETELRGSTSLFWVITMCIIGIRYRQLVHIKKVPRPGKGSEHTSAYTVGEGENMKRSTAGGLSLCLTQFYTITTLCTYFDRRRVCRRKWRGNSDSHAP